MMYDVQRATIAKLETDVYALKGGITLAHAVLDELGVPRSDKQNLAERIRAGFKMLQSDGEVAVLRQWDDWTSDGRKCNSSAQYLEIVEDVASIIRNIRVGANPISESRLIVSQLAHKHGLAPRGGR